MRLYLPEPPGPPGSAALPGPLGPVMSKNLVNIKLGNKSKTFWVYDLE